MPWSREAGHCAGIATGVGMSAEIDLYRTAFDTGLYQLSVLYRHQRIRLRVQTLIPELQIKKSRLAHGAKNLNVSPSLNRILIALRRAHSSRWPDD